MRLSMTHWAAAAAMLVATAGQAATYTLSAGSNVTVLDPAGSGRTAEMQFGGGNGTLEFSNGTGELGGIPTSTIGGLVGALNVAKVTLNPLDDAQIKEDLIDIDGDMIRGVVKIGASVTSLTVDDVTGEILTVASYGGAQQLAPRIAGVLNGGEMNVSNLRFDLANKTVVADVAGTPLVYDDTTKLWGPGTETIQKDLVLWTIGDITGPHAIRPEALLATVEGDFSKMNADGFMLMSVKPAQDPGYIDFTVAAVDKLGGLRVTEEGFAFFASALGLKAGSTGYNALMSVNEQPDGWGSISSYISFNAVELTHAQTVLPEPSSYALMGLGLVGIALVAGRRRM